MPPRWTAIAIEEIQALGGGYRAGTSFNDSALAEQIIKCCVAAKLKSLRRRYPMVDERDTRAG